MFNLLPGQGLGSTGNREIAFGLNPVVSTIIITEVGGGVPNWRRVDGPPRPRKPRHTVTKRLTREEKVTVIDNSYSVIMDDREISDLLNIIFEVIE